MSQDYLHQHDLLALYLVALFPHRDSTPLPPPLKLLPFFYIDCCIGPLFFHAMLGPVLWLGLSRVLSCGGIVCRLHQVTVAHTLCRVSGMALAPVILSTPLQGPSALGVIVQALLHLIVGTIVREGSVVTEPVSSV